MQRLSRIAVWTLRQKEQIQFVGQVCRGEFRIDTFLYSGEQNQVVCVKLPTVRIYTELQTN